MIRVPRVLTVLLLSMVSLFEFVHLVRGVRRTNIIVEPLVDRCVGSICNYQNFWGTVMSTQFAIRSARATVPLALHGSCLSRNSSSGSHPPPTRTITVVCRIRTIRRICWSPNWKENGLQLEKKASCSNLNIHYPNLTNLNLHTT